MPYLGLAFKRLVSHFDALHTESTRVATDCGAPREKTRFSRLLRRQFPCLRVRRQERVSKDEKNTLTSEQDLVVCLFF